MKVGLTKINYERMNAPLFIKLHDEIYYITYEEDYVGIENGFKKYSINKIVIELNPMLSPGFISFFIGNRSFIPSWNSNVPQCFFTSGLRSKIS